MQLKATTNSAIASHGIVTLEQQLQLVMKKQTATQYISNLKGQCLAKIEKEKLQMLNSDILVRRHCKSTSAEHGFIHFDIQFKSSHILIEQYLPWHITVYLYKLPRDITIISLQQAITRKRGTVVRLRIPLPMGQRRISLEYDLSLLKYTEYPIDPHRGLDIAPARIIFTPQNNESESTYFWTMPSLVRMPVPDFSMPYNVITITCTLLALFHGQLFNRLTRNFSFSSSNNEKPLKRLVKRLIFRIKELL